ncbi:MAG: type II toxin-antitoxin system HipA family toxin [Deltaproteobacteria bacterium]|nr:type II toxin-antitoxin system HipA family toxin [Deltaproteobacteria bacterium]
MKRSVQVCLGTDETDEIERHAIGELRYDRQGRRESAAFSYRQAWLTHRERFSIDPALPLVSGFQFHKRRGQGSLFHGAIADTEPDGWGRRIILRDHAKQREILKERGQAPEIAVLGELDFLLAVDDESRVGALRFRDEKGVFQGAWTRSGRRTPPLVEMPHLLASSRAVEMRTETAQDLAYLQGRGTSLGGLRPKCSLRDTDGHLAICKFPSVTDERSVTKGEVLALHLAKQANINAAEARVVMSDELPVAVIRRFDRDPDGKRIPYMSAATLLGAEPHDPQEHYYTEIVDAIRVHGCDAQRDIEELYRRIAFSIAINNVDDHLHNHGFLHVGHGQWRLAPAFDINPFPDRVRELKTWISEDTGPEASLSALRAVAPYFRIRPSTADTIVAEVTASVRTWRKVGAHIGMTRGELDAFAEAFA